ncbi:TNF receptor-associated factor 6-like isoform X3 [Ixodes scapularis]|uniref:TNF receptor-associated factor 6-like isoform X3 n=1 Tax=Ixodes scapularis TaxID=6945 RepID=UPI001C391E91|nr:TNF receptor-associated factor 6-like isoform X3 [Ixodes scapularis]
MEFEETRSDETHPHTGYKEHSLDGVCNVTLEYKNAEHCEKSDKDPVICSGCGLFVQRNNMQKHTYLSCPERIIFCERCHSSFPCSMEETHKSQCPKMERECSDWDVNVLNENLQHYLDTECQKRVVLCGACNSMMCYDERGKHRSECPKIERKCPDCGVNVLNENLQNHQDMECQNRVVLCDARNGAVFYHTLGDHEEECLEKPLVCEDCKGEILRKDESKHASECPMRAVCCENCDGFYPYSSEKEHRSECPKIEKSCSDCGVKVLNENLQSHQEVECQMRVVFCGACKSAMSYYKLGVHDQVCPEKPVVCDDCKGEVLRKDESKHASECPMRVVCCENCEGSYAYSSEKEHRKQCELKKLACEYCKLYLKGDDEKKAHLKICEEASIECAFKDFGCKEKFPRKEMQEHEKDPHNALLNQVILKAMDTISELQQKIKDMERCNMSLQEEAKNEKAKLVKKIQELENRQMSKQEEARNENAKLVKRIQELENRQMSKQEEARNENAKLVKRIQELENCQLEADQYRINLEDDVKVYRSVLQAMCAGASVVTWLDELGTVPWSALGPDWIGREDTA